MNTLIEKFTITITGAVTSLTGLLAAVSVVAIIVLAIIYNGSGTDGDKQQTLKRIMKILAIVVVASSATMLVTWARGI